MSKLFNIDIKDVVNSLIMSVIGAVISAIWQLAQIFVNGGGFGMTQFKMALAFGLSAAMAYLGKRYFSNSTGDLLAKDPPLPINSTDDGLMDGQQNA